LGFVRKSVRGMFTGGKRYHSWLLFLAGLMVIGYGVFAFGRGRFGGKRQFRQYGLATAGESMLRLAIAIVVASMDYISSRLRERYT